MSDFWHAMLVAGLAIAAVLPVAGALGWFLAWSAHQGRSLLLPMGLALLVAFAYAGVVAAAVVAWA